MSSVMLLYIKSCILVGGGYLGQNLSLLHYFHLQVICAWPSKAFDTLICLQDYADFIVFLKTFCIMHISHTLLSYSLVSIFTTLFFILYSITIRVRIKSVSVHSQKACACQSFISHTTLTLNDRQTNKIKQDK